MIKSKCSNFIINTKIDKAKFKIFIFAFFSVALILSIQFVVAYASPATLNLGSADNFVILAKSGISTTGTTSITGNIGVSPVGSSSITGFGLIMDSSNQFATSSLINGRAYAADYTLPTPTIMTTAISDMETAYTDAAGRPSDETLIGSIGGLTLSPGVYTTASDLIIPTDVTLDCLGDENAVFIFQIGGTLDISSGKSVVLINDCQAKNIFWQVAGTTTLGTTSIFNGNILDQTLIAMNTGAILNGRALAQTAVTLDANNISSSNSSNITLFVLTDIILLPTSANLTINSTLQMNVGCLDQFGLPMSANSFYSSSNSSIATVNVTSGLVTAIGLGNVTIEATCGDGEEDLSTTSEIIIDPAIIHKSVPILDKEFFILLIVSTLILGLYAIKRHGR